jgi:tetratricopeptide (TPR) repeat protein
LEIGRCSEAEAAVREALEIHKQLFDGGQLKENGYIERYLAGNFTGLARVLTAAGKADEAEKSCRQAVNLLERSSKEFPHSAYHRLELVKTYLQLAGLLCELGRQTEAAEPYRAALELNTEDPAISNELAWFLATSAEPRLRDATQAVRLAKQAVVARKGSPDCWNTLGVAHYRIGDNKAAVTVLEKAMSLRSGGTSYDWFFLAMAHFSLGDHAKAWMWFDRAVHWMDKHKPRDHELRRFRTEAEAMLAQLPKR